MMNIHWRMNRCLRISLTIIFACGLMASHAAAQQFPPDTSAIRAKVGQKPFPPAYAYWLGLIGEYGPDDSVVMVLERTGRLFLLHNREEVTLRDVSRNVYEGIS